MTNTTWNPADKATIFTLSGGNLIATANAANASGGIRSIAQLTGVRTYFEITLNATGNAFPGIATGAASIVTAPGGANTVVVASGSGLISINGTSSGISLSAFSAGQIACAAVDLISNLIWFRKGAGGNWNNNVVNNPATSVGGISISSLFAATPAYVYGAFQLVANGTSFTANLGDSAFSGVVPSGYIAGFPTVAPSGGTQASAMVLA